MTNFTAYRKRVFRNFATVVPSQNLVDDLVASAKNQKLITNFFYRDEDFSKQKPIERILQRSEKMIVASEIQAKFQPQNWYATRYSDGSWPVLYTAESEETALQEVLYHLKKFYQEELKSKEVSLDRRVMLLKIKSQKSVNLINKPKLKRKQLISYDESGYPYCQQLAKKYLEEGAELMIAPSARHAEGICVPIFKAVAIEKDEGHLKYLKIVLSKNYCRVFSEER